MVQRVSARRDGNHAKVKKSRRHMTARLRDWNMLENQKRKSR